MSKLRIVAAEVLRYKGEYLKFEPTESLEIGDETLAKLLLSFGVAEKISGEPDIDLYAPVKGQEKLPFTEIKEAVETFKETPAEKPVKREGKKSIFFEVN